MHARHSCQFFLHVTAHPDFGLPYEQGRLIPIWVVTLALQLKDRTIHFDSAAQMLGFFRLPKDGPHYQRLVSEFQRIFAATIFFGTEETLSGAKLIDFSRFHFFDCMRLWFNSDPARQAAHSVSHDNVVTLSETFHQEIDQPPIPVEREAIACLAHAPGTLDFYIWLVWKTWTVNRASVRIPLFGPHGLSQQLGTAEYSHGRFFRRKLQHWLRQVKVVWPDCPAAMSNDRQMLVVGSSKISPAIHTAREPCGRRRELNSRRVSLR